MKLFRVKLSDKERRWLRGALYGIQIGGTFRTSPLRDDADLRAAKALEAKLAPSKLELEPKNAKVAAYDALLMLSLDGLMTPKEFERAVRRLKKKYPK